MTRTDQTTIVTIHETKTRLSKLIAGALIADALHAGAALALAPRAPDTRGF